MPDSSRFPLSHQDEADLRERQIAALLDEGLDRYFAARYDDAIHLWTRVLFLDRSHERARAYIERARKAMAELQRHSDELLEASRDLLERGEIDAARRLLSEATEKSADELQAAALRVRLDRLERARAHGAAEPGAIRKPAPDPGWLARYRWPALGIAGVLAALLAWVLLSPGRTVAPASGARGSSGAASGAHLPVLSSSEVALVRARNAMSRGRLSEALRELDRVGLDSPDRPAADRLRVEIQQLLMASVRSSSVPPLTEPVRR